MKRTGLLALLIFCACAPRPEQDAQRLHTAAVRQIKEGDLREALSLTERALAVLSPDRDPVQYGDLGLLRGEIQLLLRQTGDVAALLERRFPETDPFRRLRAKQHYLLGHFQILTNRLDEALTTLAKADQLATEAGDTEVAFSARGLRGQALFRLRRWREGEDVLTSLADAAARAHDDYHLGIALVNLGISYRVRDRFDEAVPLFERAAALDRLAMRIRAAALTGAGICYSRLGDYDRAIVMQERAVEAHQQSPRAFLVQALGELGTTYYLKNDSEQAVSHLGRALQVAKENSLTADADIWAAHLALVYIRLGEWDKAEEFNRQSRVLNESGDKGRLVYNTLYDADIALGRGRLARASELYRTALDTESTDPFNKSDAHAGLARVALANGQTRRASTEFESALNIIERTQTGLLKTDYKLSYLTRLETVYDQYVDALVSQRQFDRALEIADSSRARVLAERHGVSAGRRHSAAEFKRIAARSGRTLLAYWLGSEHSYAWAITGSGIHGITLPAAAEIEPLARAHQKAVVDALADPVRTAGAPGDALYTMLVAPFASELKPGAGVVIVPDGALSQVSFETLPVPGPTRHYWIEDVVLAVAPSLGTLAAASSPQKPAAKQSVLLVGDPLPADEYPKLQYASTEIDGVANAFPDARKAILRGKDASPRAFGAAHPEDFSLIHFTAHASANAESPLDSAVILSPDASGYKLYARDIAEQALNADLVTISACRSAGDRTYSGEGLVGFAWAFLRAGARRVLAGLWDVDDRSTAELMTATYAGLARKESPAAALRAAKLAIIRRGGAQAKPYYWGPFQLVVATP